MENETSLNFHLILTHYFLDTLSNLFYLESISFTEILQTDSRQIYLHNNVFDNGFSNEIYLVWWVSIAGISRRYSSSMEFNIQWMVFKMDNNYKYQAEIK